MTKFHIKRFPLFLFIISFCLCGFGQIESKIRGDVRLDFEPVCGGVTAHSATFVFGLQFYGDEALVMLSPDPSFGDPLLSESIVATADNKGIVKVSVDGLKADTEYYYKVIVNGKTGTRYLQRFRTFPVGLVSFKFAFGNSLRMHRLNQSALISAANELPLFFLNTGDLHYNDILTNRVLLFNEAIIGTYLNETHQYLMARTPLVYMFDDHDYGPNDSDKTAPGRESSLKSYRQVVPHYPLINEAPEKSIEQAFSVGRVRFIMTDLRSNRSPKTDPDDENKTMMGFSQREWFLQELEKSSKTHALIIWVSTVPWIQAEKQNADQWGGYSYERRLIANFIAEKKLGNLVIVSGDAHSLSADDGSHSDFSTTGTMPKVPELIASPLDNDSTSIKGGPFSHGVYEAKKGENVFGLIEIKDLGDRIELDFFGKNNKGEVLISLRHRVKVVSR